MKNIEMNGVLYCRRLCSTCAQRVSVPAYKLHNSCGVKRSLMERELCLPLIQAGIWVEGCFEPGTAMRLLFVCLGTPVFLSCAALFGYLSWRWRLLAFRMCFSDPSFFSYSHSALFLFFPLRQSEE